MMLLKITKNRRAILIASALLIIGAGLLYAYTAYGVTRTWDGGGGDANWNTAANWSGDTAPTASDIASFDGTCVTNCSPTVNVAISVAGINMAADYAGTITQSTTNTITVGSSHWVQAAGTFTGGSGSITVNGTFTLSGGTFTSTSGTLQIGRTVHSDETIMTVSGGTFTHNSGTVKFVSGGDYSKTYTVNVQTSLTLYNIEWNQGYNNLETDYLTTAAGDTVIAANNFTHTNGYLSGTWEVQGDVIIASTADGGSGTLTMTGTGSKTYTYSSSGSGPHLRVNNASISVAANTGTTNLNVHYFSLLAGTFTAPSGTMTINPSVTAAASITRFFVSGGTFNHNNGTVSFATYVSSAYAETSVINVATSLTLYNITVNATTYSSLQIPTISVTSGDTLIAENDFTFSNGSMEGAWQVQGNVVIGSGADGGTGTLTYTGSGSKTYAYSSGGIAPHLRVNSASVSVSPLGGTTSLTTLLFSLLAGTFTAPTGTMTIGRTVHGSENTLVVSGGTFNHNNGTVTFVSGGDYGQTYTIDVVTSLTLYNVEWNQGYNNAQNDYLTTAAGDTIIVANNFTHTNGILSGTWQVQGNAIIATTADGGTATLTFTGPNDQTYTDQGGSEPDGDITINKTSGTMTLASNADWNAASQDVIITSGILSMGATYNITTTALTLSAGGTLLNSGTGDLTLAGNVANAGLIRMQKGSCTNTDSVLIRSSVAGTQRSWSGAGTFTLTDVDVKDMAGSASITVYSSTNTGNNGANWTFNSGCVALPAAVNFPASKFTFPSGKVNFR